LDDLRMERGPVDHEEVAGRSGRNIRKKEPLQ